VIVATALSCAGVLGMGLTEKQFFPSSNRIEVMVELWLPEGSSIKATEREAARVEAQLAKDPDVATYVTYVGNGSPRFFLSLDQQLFRANFAQLVVLTKDLPGRERLVARLRKRWTMISRHPQPSACLGPPVNYPAVQCHRRDTAPLKAIAERVAGACANTYTHDVNFDWRLRVGAAGRGRPGEGARAR
jgi:multidrug efflux pump